MTASDERGASSNPERRKRGPRDFIWGIVGFAFAASLLLSVLSMSHYTDIVKAGVLTHILTEETAELVLDDEGVLESVNMTIDFTIVNPSPISVKAWVISYKGWVRDLPLELGVDRTRWRIDGSITLNGTEQRYYPVFVATYSFDSPNNLIIPPHSNATITRNILLNHADYPEIMAGFEDIFNYSTGKGLELQWLHYTSAVMFIVDVNMDGLSQDVNLIRRFDGVDITPGVGGAGR